MILHWLRGFSSRDCKPTWSVPDSLSTSAVGSALAGTATAIRGCPPTSSARSLQWLLICKRPGGPAFVVRSN